MSSTAFPQKHSGWTIHDLAELTNGDIDAMTTVGPVKWVLVIAAIALLIFVAARARAARKA